MLSQSSMTYYHLDCYSISQEIAHGFRFAVLCCGYTLTDFPISIRLTSLALRQSYDCPSASKATLMNMDKYFMWNHYERLHNHNKAKHNKTVCIFIGIYCMGPMSCREQSTAVRRLPRETTRAVVTSYTTSTILRSMLSVNNGFPMWKIGQMIRSFWQELVILKTPLEAVLVSFHIPRHHQ